MPGFGSEHAACVRQRSFETIFEAILTILDQKAGKYDETERIFLAEGEVTKAAIAAAARYTTREVHESLVKFVEDIRNGTTNRPEPILGDEPDYSGV